VGWSDGTPRRCAPWYFRGAAGRLGEALICSADVASAKPLELQWQPAVGNSVAAPKGRCSVRTAREVMWPLPLSWNIGERDGTGKPFQPRRAVPSGFEPYPGASVGSTAVIQRIFGCDRLPRCLSTSSCFAHRPEAGGVSWSSRSPHQRRLWCRDRWLGGGSAWNLKRSVWASFQLIASEPGRWAAAMAETVSRPGQGAGLPMQRDTNTEQKTGRCAAGAADNAAAARRPGPPVDRRGHCCSQGAPNRTAPKAHRFRASGRPERRSRYSGNGPSSAAHFAHQGMSARAARAGRERASRRLRG